MRITRASSLRRHEHGRLDQSAAPARKEQTRLWPCFFEARCDLVNDVTAHEVTVARDDNGSAVARTVAITGATGLVGRYLRVALRSRPVLLLSRGPTELFDNERRLPLDLAAGPVELGVPAATTLVHLAYVYGDDRRNLEYAGHLLDWVNGCPDVRHVVLISSVSVYGWAVSGVIDEATPCRPDSEYAEVKLACEQLWRNLLRADCRLSILRPSIILAPGGVALDAVAGDALRRPLIAALKRSAASRSSMHLVPVDNVVEAIRLMIDRPPAALRETFLIADDEAPENADYAALQDAIRAVHGLRALPTLPVPMWAEGPLGWLLRRPLGVRRRFSTGALREIGYQSQMTLSDEITRTILAAYPAPFRPT